MCMIAQRLISCGQCQWCCALLYSMCREIFQQIVREWRERGFFIYSLVDRFLPKPLFDKRGRGRERCAATHKRDLIMQPIRNRCLMGIGFTEPLFALSPLHLYLPLTSSLWKWWVAFLYGASWLYHIANETLWSLHICHRRRQIHHHHQRCRCCRNQQRTIKSKLTRRHNNSTKYKLMWHALYFSPFCQIIMPLVHICNINVREELNSVPLLKITVEFYAMHAAYTV